MKPAAATTNASTDMAAITASVPPNATPNASPDLAGLARCNPRLAAWFAWAHDDWQGADATGAHVHLGCGDAVLDGFVNLDFLPHDGRVRECRLLDIWPQRLANSVAAFYAEDVIEHFFLTEQLYILCSMNALLRPGGVARLLTPDMGQLWTYGQRFDAAALVGSGDYFADVMRCRNGMDAVNTGMRMGGHRWLHDFTSLRRVAAECGFEARRTPCATSDDPKLCNINLRDESGISFAAELRKTRPLRHLLIWPEHIANAEPANTPGVHHDGRQGLPTGASASPEAMQPVFRAVTNDPGITYRLPGVSVDSIAMLNVRSANLCEFREHNFAKAYFRLEESGAVYADRTLHSAPHMNGFTRADVQTAMRGEPVLHSLRFDPSERTGDLFTVGPLELFVFDDANAVSTNDPNAHAGRESARNVAVAVPADVAPGKGSAADSAADAAARRASAPTLPAQLEDHVMATPCRQGVIHHFDFDGPVGMALAIYGEWAQAELDALAPYVPAGGGVLDVGANVGTHAVAFARMTGPAGRVVAVEPQGEVFALLCRTVAKNDLAHVVSPLRAGVGGAAGEARVPRIAAPEGQNLGAVRLLAATDSAAGQDAASETDTVPLLTINDLARRLTDNGGRLDLIKVDAEGDEAAILRGGEAAIRASRPVLHLECSGFARAWPAARQALAWDYAVFHLRLPAFNPDNYRGATRNVFGRAEEGALLCIPREKLMEGLLPAPRGVEVRNPADLARALLETRAYGQPEETVPAAVRLDLALSEIRRKRAEEHCVAANARSGRQHGRITTLRKAAREAEALLTPHDEAARETAEPATAARTLLQDALCATAPERPAINEPDSREPWPAPPSDAAWQELAARRAACTATPERPAPERPISEHPVMDVIVPAYRGLGQTLACLYAVLTADLPQDGEGHAATRHDGRPPQSPDSLDAPRAHVVVINDASPEPELTDALRRLAALGLVELVENPVNRGFVASVNAGMALHPQRDVVLLNSDTIVHPGWLARLAAHLGVHPEAGSVTPLSNNATICSYPVTERDNRAGLEINAATLDALAATVNAGVAVDIPTGVGFCMLIRRACLAPTGPFDEAAFGLGYGEENDFCMRAAALGWRHLLAADVFVRHAGEMSFGETAAPLKEAAFETVQRLHPAYLRTVAAHCAADPARPARRALDLARLRRALGQCQHTGCDSPQNPCLCSTCLERNEGVPRSCGPLAAGGVRKTDCAMTPASTERPVLMVAHNWGGGTERHVQDLCRRLTAEGVPALVLRPLSNDAGCVWTLNLPQPLHLPNLAFDLPPDFGALLETLAELNVGRIHVHNLAGYPHAAPELLPFVARLLDIPLDVTVHDLSPLCPRITCTGPDNFPCPVALDGPNAPGTPDAPSAVGVSEASAAPFRCTACVAAQTPQLGNADITRWRAAWGTLLHAARRVFTPSRDTAQRLAAHYPACASKLTVRSHPEDAARTWPAPPASAANAPATAAPPHAGEPLHVAVIGAIGPHKGAHVLEACARHARDAGLPIRFTVVGYTDRDDTLRDLGVVITGRYEADQLPELLANLRTRENHHIAFLPAVWPETWSYTLSEAVLAGLYPVTFNLGAPAERMAAWGHGLPLPVDMMRDPAAINAALLACATSRPAHPQSPDLAAVIAEAGHYPAPFLATYYGASVSGQAANPTQGEQS